MEQRVQVIILDANRYIPFLNTFSPINTPTWVSQYQYEQLQILGFNVKKISGSLFEKVENKPQVNEQKNNVQQPSEIIEPVVEEVTETVEVVEEIQEVTETTVEETVEEEAVEEGQEKELIDADYVNNLKDINEVKEILDQMEINYEGVNKIRDLKKLVIDNL